MRIVDAWIDDPTLDGIFEPPQLCVLVTEMPDNTIPETQFARGWTVGKFGPFVKYAQHDSQAILPSPVSAGDFNVQFRGRFPVVVDIILVVKTEGDEDIEKKGFSLPLTRARQLVKKHCPEWRLLLSDKDAMNGSLIWRPVETDPFCHAPGLAQGELCERRPTTTVQYRGVSYPLCLDHLRIHNENFARMRTTTSKT